jgi:hypothetical protein
MTREELKLEILKIAFPVYRDLTNFKRVADDLYNWVAPEGLPSEKSKNSPKEAERLPSGKPPEAKQLPPKAPVKEKAEQGKKS